MVRPTSSEAAPLPSPPVTARPCTKGNRIMMHRTVAEIMTRDVATACPEASLGTVAWNLACNDVSALPVVDTRHHPIGIVSEADLLRRPRRASPQGRRGQELGRVGRAEERSIGPWPQPGRNLLSATADPGTGRCGTRVWLPDRNEAQSGTRTAAPLTRSAARSRKAWSARLSGYGLTVTRMPILAAVSRKSRPSCRVLDVTLRRLRSSKR